MIGKKQNIHPRQYAVKKKIIVVISLVVLFVNPLLIFLTKPVKPYKLEEEEIKQRLEKSEKSK